MSKHIMVDLETFGTSSIAAIVSIGAVEFDPYSVRLGTTYYANVDAGSAVTAGMQLDASAVYFWLEQLKDVQSNLLTNRISLKDALGGFRMLAQGNYIWAHATFDPVILANAYTLIGAGRGFNYKDVRDLRTLAALTPNYAQCPCYAARNQSKAHNSLEDAITQARVVQWCFAKLKHGIVDAPEA